MAQNGRAVLKTVRGLQRRRKTKAKGLLSHVRSFEGYCYRVMITGIRFSLFNAEQSNNQVPNPLRGLLSARTLTRIERQGQD